MTKADLFPIAIYIIFIGTHYIISFSLQLGWAGVFVFGGEIGHFQIRRWWKLAQSSHRNTHNKRSLIPTSRVCHRRHAAGRNQQVEEYKHTDTHHSSNSNIKFVHSSIENFLWNPSDFLSDDALSCLRIVFTNSVFQVPPQKIVRRVEILGIGLLGG